MAICISCLGEKCKGECLNPDKQWDGGAAIDLCIYLEAIAPKYGAHVALTGGCLYKNPPRKDCDIVFYRHGGRLDQIDRRGLVEELVSFGDFEVVRATGRVYKMLYQGRNVDFLWHDTDEAADTDVPPGSSGG